MKTVLLALLLLPFLSLCQTPVVSVSATQTSICQGTTVQLTATASLSFSPQTTPVLNPQPSGTQTVTCDCPSGYVAVGYQVNSEQWMDRIRLACKKLKADGSLEPTVIYTSSAGGDGGTSKAPAFFSDNSTALVGVNLTKTTNEIIDGLRFAFSITGYGQPISAISSGTNNSAGFLSLPTVGGDREFGSGSDAGTVFVPAGNVVTGMTVEVNDVFSSNYVGGVSLRYLPINTVKNVINEPATINWNTGQTGSTIAVSPTQNTVYTATATNTYGTSAPASVTITVGTKPAPPGTSNVTYCQNAAASELTATGTNLKWYTSQVGGTVYNSIMPSTINTGTRVYYVSQANASGCESDRAALTVTVNALPAQYSVTGSGEGCVDAVGTAIVLSGSQVGVSYQLLRDDMVVGNPVDGTGSSYLSMGIQNVGGTYTVRATNKSTSCQQLMLGAAVYTTYPLPTQYAVTGGGAYCAGGIAPAVSLQGSQTGVNYQLLLNGNAVGSPVAGTGSAISFGDQTLAGTYTVRATNATTSCQQTMMGSVNLTVNPQPTQYTVTGGGAYCQGGSGVAVGLSGSQTGVTYRLLLNGNSVGSPLTGTGNAMSFGNQTVDGTYTVLATNATTNCQRVMNSSQTVTINPLPNVSITGLSSAYCQDATAVALAPLGSPAGGSFAIDGSPTTVFNPSKLALGDRRVTYSYSDANGCTNGASQTVTVKPTPGTPTVVTQSGGSYPAGVSNLTISQNTGNVVLAVSGCQGGTISWSGGNSTTLVVSTANLGTQSFTATCTSNGCTSPTATAMVTVVAPTLKVLSRDPDNGQLGNNTIKPYLLLQNAGSTPIPYSTITLRYWLTTENSIPLNFQKNYVQIGQGNLALRYVPLTTPRQGATGYIEYSFSAGAGSLAPNGDSGPLEVQATKQDYSQFVQSDDYSYINNSSFTLNPRITAYQNGVIFYGTEPTGTGSSREAAPEASSLLVVKVLGNPVVGLSAEVEISGVSGQTVHLKLVDLQGKTLQGHAIHEAGLVERVSVPLGNAQGLLLLEVSTASQRQQVKLLRP